ncbi:MAG TPA: hypothetical protein PK875_00595 [Spirochaetota bacterium]|nr:hypothetical protein [Spirochaetota bacterium]
MKSLSMFAVAVFFSAGAAFAQTDTPAPAAPSSAVTGFRITRITGTVNIIKDGKVLVTLNPGDAVPAIEGGWITFAVVEGTLELEAAGKTITAATGSNFTVGSVDGRMDISVAAGTPVVVKAPSGHNLVVTANSAVRLSAANGGTGISVERGIVVMTDASGGRTQTLRTGETATAAVPPAPAATAAAGTAAAEEPAAAGETAEETTSAGEDLPPPPPSAAAPIETEVLEESQETSASNP